MHHIAGITFWIRRWPIQTQKYCGLLSLIFNVYKIQLFKKKWPPMNISTPPPSSLLGHLKVSLPVGCHLTHLDHPLGLSSVRFQMPSKIACIWGCILTFGCICSTFLHCVFSNISVKAACPVKSKTTLFAFVWFFSTVHFYMCPQITWACMITLVAYVFLFYCVGFQMNSQMACLWGCKGTLVTFVRLFSSVRLQMHH